MNYYITLVLTIIALIVMYGLLLVFNIFLLEDLREQGVCVTPQFHRPAIIEKCI